MSGAAPAAHRRAFPGESLSQSVTLLVGAGDERPNTHELAPPSRRTRLAVDIDSGARRSTAALFDVPRPRRRRSPSDQLSSSAAHRRNGGQRVVVRVCFRSFGVCRAVRAASWTARGLLGAILASHRAGPLCKASGVRARKHPLVLGRVAWCWLEACARRRGALFLFFFRFPHRKGVSVGKSRSQRRRARVRTLVRNLGRSLVSRQASDTNFVRVAHCLAARSRKVELLHVADDSSTVKKLEICCFFFSWSVCCQGQIHGAARPF